MTTLVITLVYMKCTEMYLCHLVDSIIKSDYSAILIIVVLNNVSLNTLSLLLVDVFICITNCIIFIIFKDF